MSFGISFVYSSHCIVANRIYPDHTNNIDSQFVHTGFVLSLLVIRNRRVKSYFVIWIFSILSRTRFCFRERKTSITSLMPIACNDGIMIMQMLSFCDFDALRHVPSILRLKFSYFVKFHAAWMPLDIIQFDGLRTRKGASELDAQLFICACTLCINNPYQVKNVHLNSYQL